MDVAIASQWSGFIIAVITIVSMLIRMMAKMKRNNSEDTLRFKSVSDLIEKLNAEIQRQEKVIQDLSLQIKMLTGNINELRNLEIAAATDFGSLETTMLTVPCVDCKNQGDGYKRLHSVVERMRARREKRKALIEEASNVNA